MFEMAGRASVSGAGFAVALRAALKWRGRVSRRSANFIGEDTAWGTPGQLVEGTVWVQVAELLDIR